MTQSHFATPRTVPSGVFVPTIVPAPRGYEELEGAQGREIFFRPQRYTANEFAPVRGEVTLALGAAVVVGEVVDVSQSGVAFRWPDADIPEVGMAVASLRVDFDGRPAFQGPARISSVRGVADGAVVGVSFAHSSLDIDELMQLRVVKVWAADEPVLGLDRPGWRVAGHEGFRSLVGDFRLFLEDARERLGAWEAELPWELVHGDTEGAPRLALIDRMRRDFVPTVLDYYGRLDAAVRGADPQDLPALRQFSQRTLDDLMLQAPLLYRARNKPLGYPGDFECMNDMYFRNFRGTSLFARALQLASCLSPPAEAVRARKDLIKDEIHRLVASHSGDRPLRIASIAAGPAQEIFEFLQEAKELPGRLEIVLFDQDKLALSFAQRRIAPLVEARWSSQVRVVFLNDSIKRLLHDPTLFGTLGPFDLLFSTGLFDYLRFPTAVNLCRNLHLNTAPGGRAFVGNMDPANPARWVFEHHLEWYLIYRTSGEMLEFGRTALPDARLEMAPDRTFLNPFLVMHKD